MYGQTEATARMAYLPTELAERHPPPWASRSRAGACASSPRRRADRRRRARLRRPQRDDGLRGRPGRPGRAAPNSASCTPATSPRSRPGSSRWSAEEPVREGLRTAPRPRRDRAKVRAGSRRPASRSTASWRSSSLAARRARRRRGGRAVRHPELGRPRASWPTSPPRARARPTTARSPSSRTSCVRRAAPTGGASAATSCARSTPDCSAETSSRRTTRSSLGADSLSYVELSVRLGETVDPLPRDWHRRTIAELAPATTGRTPRARHEHRPDRDPARARDRCSSSPPTPTC